MKKHLWFLLPAALICAGVGYVGAVRTHTAGHDVLQFLDVAWRLLNGQRPHVDFYSPMGPLAYLFTAAGLALSGLRVEGMGLGNAMFGAAVGIWGYRLALSRMSHAAASLTGVFVVLLAAAPQPLGAGPASLSHAMYYNRFGSALLALILLEVIGEPNQPGRRGRASWLSGFSTGVAAGLLFQLKASYFLVGVSFVLVFYALGRRRLPNWLGFVGGAVIALLPAVVWLGSGITGMVADQLFAGAARGQRVDLNKLFGVAYRSAGEAILLLLVAILSTDWKRGAGIVRWKWPLAAVAVFGAGVMLITTNAQDAGLPLGAVLIMLMTGGAARSGESPTLTRRACALAAVLLLAASASVDAASLLVAVREKHSPPGGAHAFLPAHMRGLLLYDLPDPSHPLANSNGNRYVDVVNSGIRLLQAQSSPGESVITLEQYNPFSYALLRKPGRGGFTFLAWGYSVSTGYKPPADRLFGGTDIVMVPKRNITDPALFWPIIDTYLPDVQRMFTLAAENADWWMYRRKHWKNSDGLH
ncbi:MAG: hypothetical protein ACE141_04290 [Bryobacteraceae bacterium]